MKSITLTSARLNLQPLDKGDFAYFFETWNDVEFRKFLFDDKPVSKELAETIFEMSAKNFATENFGYWALRLKETETFIGVCGLFFSPNFAGEIELLFGIERKFWGAGFAFEASETVLKYAFALRRIEKIIGCANPQNTASWRILEKLGFKFEREIKTENESLCCYTLFSKDFLKPYSHERIENF